MFCIIHTLIKNILRKVENYPRYTFPNILREIGIIQNIIKKGRKSSQWAFGIQQYIKGCGNPSKNLIIIYSRVYQER